MARIVKSPVLGLSISELREHKFVFIVVTIVIGLSVTSFTVANAYSGFMMQTIQEGLQGTITGEVLILGPGENARSALGGATAFTGSLDMAKALEESGFKVAPRVILQGSGIYNLTTHKAIKPGELLNAQIEGLVLMGIDLEKDPDVYQVKERLVNVGGEQSYWFTDEEARDILGMSTEEVVDSWEGFYKDWQDDARPSARVYLSNNIDEISGDSASREILVYTIVEDDFAVFPFDDQKFMIDSGEIKKRFDGLSAEEKEDILGALGDPNVIMLEKIEKKDLSASMVYGVVSGEVIKQFKPETIRSLISANDLYRLKPAIKAYAADVLKSEIPANELYEAFYSDIFGDIAFLPSKLGEIFPDENTRERVLSQKIGPEEFKSEIDSSKMLDVYRSEWVYKALSDEGLKRVIDKLVDSCPEEIKGMMTPHEFRLAFYRDAYPNIADVSGYVLTYDEFAERARRGDLPPQLLGELFPTDLVAKLDPAMIKDCIRGDILVRYVSLEEVKEAIPADQLKKKVVLAIRVMPVEDSWSLLTEIFPTNETARSETFAGTISPQVLKDATDVKTLLRLLGARQLMSLVPATEIPELLDPYQTKSLMMLSLEDARRPSTDFSRLWLKINEDNLGVYFPPSPDLRKSLMEGGISDGLLRELLPPDVVLGFSNGICETDLLSDLKYEVQAGSITMDEVISLVNSACDNGMDNAYRGKMSVDAIRMNIPWMTGHRGAGRSFEDHFERTPMGGFYIPVIIGKGLAQNMGLRIGDEYTSQVMAGSTLGSMSGEMRLKVVGVYDVGIPILEQMIQFAPSDLIRIRLMANGNYLPEYNIWGPDMVTALGVETPYGPDADPEEIKSAVLGALPPEMRGGVTILTWDAIVKYVAGSMMEVVNFMLLLSMIVTLVLCAMTIKYIMDSTVLRKTREIGTLKALGATNGAVAGIFLLQAIIIGILASVIGFLGSVGVLQLINSLIGMGGMIGSASIDVWFVLTWRWWVLALVFVLPTAISLLATFFPARRAAKLAPVEAIRQGEMAL